MSDGTEMSRFERIEQAVHAGRETFSRDDVVYLIQLLRWWAREAGRRQRTPNQMRAYWGILVKRFGDMLGMDQDMVHAYFKKWLPAGKTSTAELSTEDMSQYMERILRELPSTGIEILPPGASLEDFIKGGIER